MSQAFLAILGIFEVVLRNKIDLHYKSRFSASPDWLLASTLPGGFLTQIGNVIGTAYARSHFQEIIDIVTYMSVNSQQLFYGVDGVIKEANFIDNI
jgi:hypothetical protein